VSEPAVTLTAQQVAEAVAEITAAAPSAVLLVDCRGNYDYDTIQGAIDAASNGDTVVILPNTCTPEGVYFENINFLGKAITARSLDPADPAIVEATIIDGNQSGSVVTFESGEGADTVLDGLTIRNGLAESGGGIYCSTSSPTISKCAITNNAAWASGGGLHCWNLSSPTMTDCAFVANVGGFYGGGGAMSVLHDGSSPTLTNCSFVENVALEFGGGMYNADGGRATLTDCTFIANGSAYGGAIFSSFGGPLTLANCVFIGNFAGLHGGGIYSRYGSRTKLTNCSLHDNWASLLGGGMCSFVGGEITLTNCTFSANWAGLVGGGVSDGQSNSTFTNCIFGENSAEYGGGMYNFSNHTTATNCTFSGNSATHGATLACDSYEQQNPSTVVMANCILWDGGAAVWNNDGSTITITYSDVEGGWPGDGNIDGHPLFVDADGPDNIPGTEDDDLRLLAGSPCIDAADNTAVPPDIADLDGDGDTTERTPFDLDGNPRFVDDAGTADTGVADPPDYTEVVDMGAYEFLPSFLDIKPGSCPNPLNRKSHGVLPVALVGTPAFDPTSIDVASLLLARADGVGGSVPPNEGPPGPHSVFEDVASPFEGEPCDCHEEEGDGFTDLSMKFRTDEVVESLELNDLPAGAAIELIVSGHLLDGTPFEASDCIALVPG
jgi:predicted outer membrane repeat protein